jgi:hypothetical protein
MLSQSRLNRSAASSAWREHYMPFFGWSRTITLEPV